MNLNEDRRKLLEIMEKLKELQTQVMADEKFLELQTQAQELAEFDDEESKKELEELGQKAEEYILDSYVNPLFSKYTIDEMKNIILSLNEDMFDDETKLLNYGNRANCI